MLAAGVIVTAIGLGIVLINTLAIPRYWTTLVVGLGLLGVGAARRAMASRDRRGNDAPR